MVGLTPRMARTVVEAQERLDRAFVDGARRAAVEASAFETELGPELASLVFPARIDLRSTTIETGCDVAATRFVEGRLSLTLFGRPVTHFLSARYEEGFEEAARLSLTVDVIRSPKGHSEDSDR